MTTPPEVHTHPDASLLDLARQHAEASVTAAGLSAQAEAAFDRAALSYPPPPASLVVRAEDRGPGHSNVGGVYSAEDIGRWRRAVEIQETTLSLTPEATARFLARGREVLAAWEAHREAVEACVVAEGARTLSADADLAHGALYKLEEQILQTQATTPEGWRIKAGIAAQVIGDEPDGTYEDHVVRSLLSDLLAAPG